MVDDVRAPVESPALCEVLAEFDPDGATAGAHSLLRFACEQPGASCERHVIESGRFGGGYHVAVIVACQVVAVASPWNVAVELILVSYALEVQLDLSGIEDL